MGKLRLAGAMTVLLLAVASPARAGDRELKTVESATEAVRGLAAIPLKGIPQSLLQDAAGVAVIPHVVKAALVVDREFGRGVILAHQPDGQWSNPVFVTLKGHGVGGEAGIEATELVLVFKTKKSLDRALRGKLTLGSDVAVAAGPVGRDTEVARDRRLKAEVFSYSRSRGLFVGVSLEGNKLHVDEGANEDFYHVRGGRAADVLGLTGVPIPAAVLPLQEQLTRLSMPSAPPAPVVPAPVVPAPPPVILVPAPPPIPR
ncbi:MAG TPA: lipid-binding SYLF domain-containing protein [Gemmataceae bacterium]|nr:lipid-binding SYLF domain-containing protein [Gemmataceae bacterium]